MKHSLFTVSALTVLTLAGSVFARPTAQDFAYQKDVLSPNGETKIVFDQDILQNVDERFGNFQIYNGKNEEIDFALHYENSSRLKTPQVFEVSSIRSGTKKSLVDSDINTSFLFDETVDRRNPSWALIDLGRLVPVNRVEVFVPDNSRIRTLEILGGAEANDLGSIMPERAFEWQNNFSSNPVRFLKLNFSGLRIEISDIRITTSRNGSAYFTAPAGERVKVLYGGSSADHLMFKERFSAEKPGKIAQLSNQKWNPILRPDVDGDSIANSEDNCPFVANRGQRDSDDDRVGNACDNAEDVKNITQVDSDFDGVGDVIDNCKLTKNPDQADRDADGRGDACDGAHASISPMAGNDLVKTALIVLAVLAVIFIVWKNSNKK